MYAAVDDDEGREDSEERDEKEGREVVGREVRWRWTLLVSIDVRKRHYWYGHIPPEASIRIPGVVGKCQCNRGWWTLAPTLGWKFSTFGENPLQNRNVL